MPFSLKQLWFDLHQDEFATHYRAEHRPTTRIAYEIGENNEKVTGSRKDVVPPRYQPIVHSQVFLSQRAKVCAGKSTCSASDCATPATRSCCGPARSSPTSKEPCSQTSTYCCVTGWVVGIRWRSSTSRRCR